MSLKKRISHAYLLPEGNLAIFDFEGQQISELQGTYSIDKHKRILLEAVDTCLFEGFNILPAGFIGSATDYANYFRAKDLSWEEIKNL